MVTALQLHNHRWLKNFLPGVVVGTYLVLHYGHVGLYKALDKQPNVPFEDPVSGSLR